MWNRLLSNGGWNGQVGGRQNRRNWRQSSWLQWKRINRSGRHLAVGDIGWPTKCAVFLLYWPDGMGLDGEMEFSHHRLLFLTGSKKMKRPKVGPNLKRLFEGITKQIFVLVKSSQTQYWPYVSVNMFLGGANSMQPAIGKTNGPPGASNRIPKSILQQRAHQFARSNLDYNCPWAQAIFGTLRRFKLV